METALFIMTTQGIEQSDSIDDITCSCIVEQLMTNWY